MSLLIAGGSLWYLAGSEPKRLGMSSSSKRSDLRRSVRSEAAPVSRARSATGAAEDHDRTDKLVHSLLGPFQQEFKLAPLLGGIDPFSTPPDHAFPLTKRRRRSSSLANALWRSSPQASVATAPSKVRTMPRVWVCGQLYRRNSAAFLANGTARIANEIIE